MSLKSPLNAPEAFTMERLGNTKQVVVAQSTSQMCRTGCCQVRASRRLVPVQAVAVGHTHLLRRVD